MVKTAKTSTAVLDERSLALRSLVIDALEGGQRGHVGSAMSLIEILRTLYDSVLRFEAADPAWAERDRLILSKGHGCLALYAVLADKGFFPSSELWTFCKFDSPLGGHPERGPVPGVEASTGSLGHGLAVGTGMAYAARMQRSGARVYVIVGDGEIDEGSVWESALAAGHHQLANLTVVIDYNKLQSYGPVAEIWDLEPLADKWRAFGFDVSEVDGHDVEQLHIALSQRQAPTKPLALIAHTIKGRGLPFAEHNPQWHHKSRVTPAELIDLRKAVADA
jgi:transketolase